MRRHHVVLGAAVLLGGIFLIASIAVADSGKRSLQADSLTGYQENPDISTAAGGSFQLWLDDAAETLTYELSYSGLEGDMLQSHIHFGKRAVNGGITVFLCTNLGNGPAGTPACPQEGTVSRTVPASEILAPGTQGIEPGNFAELAAALRSGHTYANVHSTKWPGGEIRAQINDQNQREN